MLSGDALTHVQIARPTLSCIWDSSDLPGWVTGALVWRAARYLGHRASFRRAGRHDAERFTALTCAGGDTALWHNRWKLVARASRLGFNVMSVDSDSMFFRDPYVHLKKPPLKDLQV